MTNEEAMVFMDNLMICVNEHPIIADWLVEIENRKTKPNYSENPNNYKSKCCECRRWSFEFGCQSKYKCEFEPYRKENE